jgi:hypothetical protein
MRVICLTRNAIVSLTRSPGIRHYGPKSGYHNRRQQRYRRATATEFVRNGVSVVAVGRNEADLATLRHETRESKGKIKTHLADVTEFTQIDRFFLKRSSILASWTFW